MDKETFYKNLSTLLDVLSSTSGNHTSLCGDNGAGEEMFRMSASGLSRFNVLISDAASGEILVELKDMYKDDIFEMFGHYVINSTERMYIFLPSLA